MPGVWASATSLIYVKIGKREQTPLCQLFALAAGLQKQGLDRWMAAWVIGKAGNRLDIALLVPLFIGMAPQIGDVSIAVVIAMACSCAFLLPVATPPNAIIFGSGCVPQRQMIRCGFWVSLLILPVLFGVAAVLR